MAILWEPAAQIAQWNFGTGANTVTVSTSGTNRLLVAFVPLINYTNTPTCTVTAPGLVWNKSIEIARTVPNGGHLSQVWWAWCTATLSSVVITATPNAGSIDGALIVMPVSGAKNLSGLATGTDYATASLQGTGYAGFSQNITTIGSSGSSIAATISYEQQTNITPGANWTEIAENPVTLGFQSQYYTNNVAAGTYAISASFSPAGTIAVTALEILASGTSGGGGTVGNVMFLSLLGTTPNTSISLSSPGNTMIVYL